MKGSTVKCRICWEDKETRICVQVTTKWAKESLKTIKDVILLCVPWMSIDNESHLCKPCLWQLKFTYDFIERCLKTENILNEQNNTSSAKISLEDLFEKSLKNGNKIQIIFENPINSQADVTEDVETFNKTGEKSREDIENLTFKVHAPEVTRPLEHDYCVKKGTEMNIDVIEDQENNMEYIESEQSEIFNKIPDESCSKESNRVFNKQEKEHLFNDDDNSSNDDADFLNELSTKCTDEKNITDPLETNILHNNLAKKKKSRGSKTIMKKKDITQTNNPAPPPKNELTELLDIAPVGIWFVTAHSEVSTEQQNDLVRDGVNIVNMSKDPNKKKRTIFLARDLLKVFQKCTKCNSAFNSRCDFLDHEHLHRKGKIKMPDEPVYTCTFCSETFTLDIDFRTHTKVHHGIGCPHICTKCNKRFRTLKCLKDHQEIFKNQDKCVYTCAKCSREFLTRDALLNHESDVKDAPCCNYKKCNVCFKKFTREDFKVHSEQVHPNYLCPECGKSFTGSSSFSAHRKNVHNATLSMCHECGKILSHPKNLEHHIQTVHGSKIYMCDKCPRQFASKTYLRKHHKVHLDVPLKERRKWRCDDCGKVYVKKETLRQHQRMFHLGVKKFTCLICNEGFTRNDYLQRHIKNHERYIQNTCSVCKKSFGNSWRLEFHMFAGHDENGKSLERGDVKRPLGYKMTADGKRKASFKCVCKICNKVLANQANLKLHYRAHLRLRDRHKCGICGIIFQTRMALTNHVKLHEDPNFRFSCNICYAYKSSNMELERHMLEVHKNKKYKCSLCSESFGRKHLLLSHEALVHPEENQKKETLLKMLEKDQIFVSADADLECGSRSRKGTKLGNLEVDVNTVYNMLVKNGNDFDDAPGSSYQNLSNSESDNEYQSLEDEDEAACKVLVDKLCSYSD